jgi:ureidoglycolate lyase
MNTPQLPIRPLTAQAFAPYGEVLDLEGGAARSVNAGTSRRVDLPSSLDLMRAAGRPLLATFRAQAQGLQGPWHTLERHRHGSQTFVPLDPVRWVVLVAQGGDAPDVATLAAFEAGPRQGITLHPGTWHHPLIALDAGLFLVLERSGPEEDCEVVQLAVPVMLSSTPPHQSRSSAGRSIG